MCSTPRADATSWTPVAISAAAKLTACWAEPHWRSIVVAGVSTGRPASSQALRPMLSALFAELLGAAGDHVAGLGGVDAGALEELAVDLGEQVGGVQVLVVALLEVAASDRRPGRLDDDDLAAAEATLAVLHLSPPVRWTELIGRAGFKIDRYHASYGSVIGTPANEH